MMVVMVMVVAPVVPAAAVPWRACCCCWAVQLLVFEQPLVAAVQGYKQVVVAQAQPLVWLVCGLHDLMGNSKGKQHVSTPCECFDGCYQRAHTLAVWRTG
jgi:hypothetical protein